MKITFTRIILSILLTAPIFPTIVQAQTEDAYHERLYHLCKFWGFLKYRHTEIAKGTVNWDNALLDIPYQVKQATSDEEFNEILMQLAERAGEMGIRSGSLPDIPDELNNDLDHSWMDAPIFSDSIQAIMDTVKSRFRPQPNRYVTTAQAGNPSFEVDNAFSSGTGTPTEEFRVLALFRYWNIIHYFFPYKDIMDEHWDSVLVKFIPRIVSAPDPQAYHLAFKEFTASIDDSHSFFSSNTYWGWLGSNYVPFEMRFIENETVITKVLPELPVSPGSVIKRIDGLDIYAIRDSLRPYAHGSNEEIIERSINDMIAYGGFGKFKLTIEDSTGTREVELERNRANRQLLNTNDSPAWRIEQAGGSCLVGIIDMGKLEVADINTMFNSLRGADAIVFDIRNYPNGTLWTLVNYLYKSSINIANFTVPDATYPGRLSWLVGRIGSGTPTPYTGKIAILFDERTQSQAEYTVMGLEQFEGAIKIGSTTSGADGNVSRINLPGNIITYASFLGVFYPDYMPTQRIGILPDIEVRPTIEGIRKGKDEVLEYALDYLGCDLSKYNQTVVTEIKLFPNPATTSLEYELPINSSEDVMVEIIDTKGRLVKSYTSVEGRGELDIAELAQGMYYLRMIKGDQLEAKAFVKY